MAVILHVLKLVDHRCLVRTVGIVSRLSLADSLRVSVWRLHVERSLGICVDRRTIHLLGAVYDLQGLAALPI